MDWGRDASQSRPESDDEPAQGEQGPGGEAERPDHAERRQVEGPGQAERDDIEAINERAAEDTGLPEAAEHKPGFQPADLLLVVLIGLLLLIMGPQLWLAFDVLYSGATLDASQLRSIDLWLNGAILLLFGVLGFFWVLGTRNEPWLGTRYYLRLHDPWRSSLWGVGLGVAIVVALMIVGLLLQWAGSAPENPALDTLSVLLTIPLALFLSFAAAFGEEIVFRGLLQRWIGVWGQAAAFAMLHAYQGVYGIVFTLLLALLFGFMVKRGGSLWIAITAHFTFDIIQMAVLIYAGEA